MSGRFYNCHAHCFTYDHVPEYFLSPHLPVSWLLSRRWLRKWVRQVLFIGRLGWLGSVVKAVLRLLLGMDRQKLVRYLDFVFYGDKTSQEDVVKEIQNYYPSHTGYVMLSMDMEYMGAGMPRVRYREQLEELIQMKANPAYRQLLFPFVFCDPRRMKPVLDREKSVDPAFSGESFENFLKEKLRTGLFQGIKLYPALGYWPFDKRLKPVYDFALANRIPLLTHCTTGAVYGKYRVSGEALCHPVTGVQLPASKPKRFQEYFTHPLNYEFLLNPEWLRRAWGPDAPDYRGLKICIGHWGTGESWHAYLRNARTDTWYAQEPLPPGVQYPSLLPERWHVDKANRHKNYTWFSIICDLMRKYPNVYADISYTLNDAGLLPLLKMILEADEKIRQRVLFGTDFYMVSKAISEREFSINVRAALGNELFQQIAVVNAERYLENDFGPAALEP